jgi:signal recognition particle GTPase
MFTLLTGAYERWSQKKLYNVIILGLDGAGKTVSLALIVVIIDVAGTTQGTEGRSG